ncbi:hypothetical protein DF188_05925 [Aliarcobacter skirrowii]|uniref:Nucleotidyl transferase AbiEii/AbiGii toxin family protein n=1 Tax=Aliarcobacter skirrowii TaxID=28200 RepID=A0A2U2C146_9BACT|nr:hypothetical protein [Aliarcobacter skirrowii]PWE21750.1 hypothetical protein DF188_05925 [Aliarcobacter skirrowii]
MKVTDYAGLSHFQEFCKDLDDNYVVVGGFATIMLLDKQLEGHGKATYDIDLVLLTNNSLEMSKRIKKYIKEGDYKIQIGEKDQYRYYRFTEPKKDDFAKEIELFASNENDLKLEDSQRIIPIDPDEGLYSLSAIMLDQEYFEMIKENVDKTGVAPCTNVQATIILKMSAFYDLKNRGEDKWKKHRRDIFKLTLLLTGEEKLKLKGRMQGDFDSFIAHIENDLTAKDIKNFSDGLPIIKEDVIKILKEVFI